MRNLAFAVDIFILDAGNALADRELELRSADESPAEFPGLGELSEELVDKGYGSAQTPVIVWFQRLATSMAMRPPCPRG